MAVEATDLLAPNGPVEPELFPGESEQELEARLNAFISQAVARAATLEWEDQPAEDAGVTAWALYLTFRQAHTLSLTRPAEEDSKSEVLGHVTYTRDQRDELKALSEYFLREWSLLSEFAGSVNQSVIGIGIPSHQSKNVFDW